MINIISNLLAPRVKNCYRTTQKFIRKQTDRNCADVYNKRNKTISAKIRNAIIKHS